VHDASLDFAGEEGGSNFSGWTDHCKESGPGLRPRKSLGIWIKKGEKGGPKRTLGKGMLGEEGGGRKGFRRAKISIAADKKRRRGGTML